MGPREHDKNYLPGLNCPDVSDAVLDQTAKDAGACVAEKPGGMAQWLFLALVEHGNNNSKARRDGGFCHSEKETRCEKARSIEAGRR